MGLRWRILPMLLGTAGLSVAAVAIEVHARLRDRPVLGVGLAAAALALLVLFVVWRSILDPIVALHRAALDIAAGDLEARVPASSRGELGVLGATLNDLAERLAISTRRLADLQERAERLQHSLDDKELRLREVHHRVKNNLQAVSSLLDLQSRSSAHPSLKEELEASHNRIRCMALVHEELYGTERYDRIGTNQYLSRLASHLVDCFGRPPGIRLELELDGVHLDVDRAMTVGLLANELLSNALKHAFPANRPGEVRLALARQGEDCVLTVADDGVGMRTEAPLESGRSLGMNLVGTLAKQLRGSVSVENHRGTCVRITFPMTSRVREVKTS